MSNVPNSPATEVFTATASMSAYIILGFCFGLPSFLGASVIAVRPELFHDWLLVIGIDLAVVGMVITWLRKFRLQVTRSELVYRTLFSGETRLQLEEVVRIRKVVDYNPWRNFGKPRNRLEVFIRTNREKPQLHINLKVFRRGDISHLMTLLPAKTR
jgi:hypothetical protein